MEAIAPRTLPAYPVDDGFYDEAFEAEGVPRGHYERLIGELEHTDLHELGLATAGDLHSRGVAFHTAQGDSRFRMDPVPRLFTGDEWDELAAGLAQRVRALNAFLADAYGPRRIVEAGVVPAHVIEGADGFEPWMCDVPVPHGAYAGMAGLDVVRGADGRLMVLEDNVRTPSGVAYMEAARDVLEERLHESAHEPKRSIAPIYDMLSAALRASAPQGVGEPSVVLLSDGAANSAWFEHETIARALAIPLVGLADLEPHAGRLYARDGPRLVPVDVLYRRTDDDRLRDDSGRPTALAERLLEPLRRGTLACFNAFGTGLADDKLVHAYVEDMVRFYLGEEPLIGSVPTYDLGRPEALDEVLGRLGELVIKPRTGFGGYGVVIVAHASREDRERVERAVRAHPERYVAQETIALSRHPTVCGGRLEPRHVDLRPFVLTAGDDVSVIPGGLTRVAFGAGALVVNSSQNGGGKDTWVLA
jgi:carboxylate-amine ligase